MVCIWHVQEAVKICLLEAEHIEVCSKHIFIIILKCVQWVEMFAS